MKEGLESKVSFSSFDNICKVCPLDYADDLKFWGINESFMEFCCQVPNQTVEVNDIRYVTSEGLRMQSLFVKKDEFLPAG